MRDEDRALHLDVLCALPGRIRVQLQRPISAVERFEAIPGVLAYRYNPRIRTLLCEYDSACVSEEQLIVRLGAVYAATAEARVLHIRRSEERGFSMAPSGYLALGCIALDSTLALMASPLTRFSRWLSTGATLAAVVEHGYQELHVRGSFDPEVMSVVYLINSIGKPDGSLASPVAWALTFGRHLIPRAPREQAYLVKRAEREVTLTPVKGNESELAFAGSMLQRGMEMLARK